MNTIRGKDITNPKPELELTSNLALHQPVNPSITNPTPKSRTMSTLSTAALDRKTRLAALKSKSSKRPAEDPTPTSASEPAPKSPKLSHFNPPPEPSITEKYLSGRNYDPITATPRLGFESSPALTAGDTLEARAEVVLALTHQAQRAADAAAKPLDLNDLQPKRPNWDLKRDLAKKLEVLNVRTENAIAKLVKARVLAEQEKGRERLRAAGAATEVMGAAEEEPEEGGRNGEEDVVVGMDGNALARAVHQRELEEQEEERRERAEEQEND